MAALSNDRQGSPPQWNILIVAEDHPEFNKNYAVPSNTCLSYIKERWMEDCDTMEYWVFISADRTVEYDESLSLESIGEVVVGTGIVTLRAKLSDEPRPTNEIFVCLKDECHHLQVKPNDKLNDVLRDLKGRPATIECNGMPLNPQETVKQSGIENKAVICEYRRQIKVSVKLSSGVTRIVKLPEDSLVLRLFEMVSRYEDNDFSLTYQGRSLNKDESVRKLEHVVEVAQAEFTVNINNQRVSWKTRGSATSFPEFLSQLSSVGHMDRQKLEMMQFFCVGCRRCISLSDEDVQLLPVQCCKEQSLTLDVKSPIEAEVHMENNKDQSFIEIFENICRDIVRSNSTQWTEENSRTDCRMLMEKCFHEGLDYNKVKQISEKIKINIAKLNNIIKSLEVNNEKLKDENKKSATQTKEFKEDNIKCKEIIKTLKKENTKAATENQKLMEEKNTTNAEIQKLSKAKAKTATEIETWKDENARASIEIQKLKDELQKAAAEIQTFNKGEPIGAAKINTLKEPETSVKARDVKLLVFYWHADFSRVDSRPEVKLYGQYPRHTSIFHFKCDIPGLSPGWNSFEKVKEALQLLVTGRQIRRIDQRRGSVDGRIVAETTCLPDDEREELLEDREFCDADGLQFSWNEVGRSGWYENRQGDRVFICGGRRRTVLEIFPVTKS